MQQFIPFNPYMTPQQRLNCMEQQYQQNLFAQQQQNSQNLVTIPVTSIEEAKAFRDDLSGTPTFFYNTGKNEIYIKRTNTQTGEADFRIFQPIVEAPKNIEEKNFSKIYEKELKTLNEKIDGLYSLFATVQVNQKTDQVSDQVSDQVKISTTKGIKNVK